MNTLYTTDGYYYIGMSEETIRSLRLEQGKNTTFISQEEFNALGKD